MADTKPTNSTGWKELAAAKFLEAHDLEDADGNVAAEDEEAWNAAVAEGLDAEAEAGKAATREGTKETARDRFAYYHGKGTGGRPLPFQTIAADEAVGKSLGELFVDSPAYKQAIEQGVHKTLGMKFRTDPVELRTPRGMVQIGGASTDILHTEGDSSPLVVPQARRLAGIYGFGQRPLTVRSVFPNEDTDADAIEFIKQVSQDNATALAVKQSTTTSDAAGLKKQSSFGMALETAYAETIATWFAASRKSLAQPSVIRSFIDNQGRYYLGLEEEEQLVNGNGTRPNISGILDQDERLHFDISAAGGWDNLDALRHAKTMTRTGLSRLPSTWVLLNPNDSEGFDLLKDGNGLYRGGNPIGPGFAEGELPIWRLQRVETEAVEEGKAIVGSRAAATVFQRAPIRVLTTDSHEDFFVRNLVVILFEEELAFPVYFPTAIVEVELEAFTHGS